ncbi:MAG: hypothetical protein D4R64_10560 [Porphyromonadaceae bacterium]|nr:MAG: hypothetical protein D4R64_10560 [Porphyromonadaceae bacterium]
MKLNFVTRILKFNPSELMSRSLRRRRLLRNVDEQEMLRVAHSFGESSERERLIGGGKEEDSYMKLVEFLENK